MSENMYYSPPPPEPPKKNRHLVRKSVIGVGGAVIAIVVISAVASGTGKRPHLGTTTTPQKSMSHSSSVPALPPVANTPSYVVPNKNSYKMTLKILSKECFGDAGCNISYRPQLTALFQGDTDPDVTYDITYQVNGDDSGPQIETLTATGTQYESSDGFVMTPSSNTKLTVKITDVEAE